MNSILKIKILNDKIFSYLDPESNTRLSNLNKMTFIFFKVSKIPEGLIKFKKYMKGHYKFDLNLYLNTLYKSEFYSDELLLSYIACFHLKHLKSIIIDNDTFHNNKNYLEKLLKYVSFYKESSLSIVQKDINDELIDFLSSNLNKFYGVTIRGCKIDEKVKLNKKIFYEIRQLCISTKIDDEKFKLFYENTLQNLHDLEKLEISFTNLSDLSLIHILQIIENNKILTKVCLTNNENFGLTDLSNTFFNYISNINDRINFKLNLNNCQFDDKCISDIIKVKANTNVRKIELNPNNFSISGIEKLFFNLPNDKSIIRFGKYEYPCYELFENKKSIIFSNTYKYVIKDMEANGYDDDDITESDKLLFYNSFIKKFNINGIKYQSEIEKEFSDFLIENVKSNIENLIVNDPFSGNFFYSEILENLNNLKYLNFSFREFEGMPLILKKIKVIPLIELKLKCLFPVENHSIFDKILDIIKNNKNLKSLKLINWTNLDNYQLNKLLAFLKSSKIEILFLKNCRYDLIGANIFMKEIWKSSLKFIKIDNFQDVNLMNLIQEFNSKTI